MLGQVVRQGQQATSPVWLHYTARRPAAQLYSCSGHVLNVQLTTSECNHIGTSQVTFCTLRTLSTLPPSGCKQDACQMHKENWTMGGLLGDQCTCHMHIHGANAPLPWEAQTCRSLGKGRTTALTVQWKQLNRASSLRCSQGDAISPLLGGNAKSSSVVQPLARLTPRLSFHSR